MTPEGPRGRPRLVGWREIAGHLGKGVRTTQRWEKLYGLPVRRADDGTDTVWADPDELDRWAREASLERSARLAPPREGTKRRWLVPAALAGLALALAVAVLVLRAGAPPAPPASWRVAGRTVTVFDAAGRPLFASDLGYPARGVMTPTSGGSPQMRTVLFADLEGDGSIESLVKAAPEEGADAPLLCFERSGRLRFTHRPTGVVRFGGVEYAGPWPPNLVAPVLWPDGSRSLFAAFHHYAQFPTRLRELSARGDVLAEMWHAGHLHHVSAARWEGRDVLLVGGANNDWRGGGLAIVDRGRLGGATPAARAPYACDDCPAGEAPREYLVFPRSCLWRLIDSTAIVVRARVEDGRLVVDVLSAPVLRRAAGDPHPTIRYTLGPDLAVSSVQPSDDFLRMHREREEEGRLDHSFPGPDAAELGAVLRWDGHAFVPVPGAPAPRAER